jgi:hypothetical protein
MMCFVLKRQGKVFCAKEKKQQMKINNRVNERRNFHGRMSETLHENVLSGY